MPDGDVRRMPKAREYKCTRMFRRLTPRHFQRNGFDRMNVGLALDIACPETVRLLRWIRLL